MKVYTRGGDRGKTTLIGGTRVPKNDPRVNAYGDLDELISHLGLLRAESLGQPYHYNLRRIQECLMLISAHFAADDNSVKKINPLPKEEILFLEEQIDEMTQKLPPLKAFVLPERPRLAAQCHIARTVCRRAERSAVAITPSPQIENSFTYLNRLSDYLFVYARFIAMVEGVEDDFWFP
jgi:ATP:cob(I)alamin adenosyltransferase